ncbi:MAG: hypothetical protein ABIH46_08045 [Chloroflexota bacterium]
MTWKAQTAFKLSPRIIAAFTIILAGMQDPYAVYACAVEGTQSYQPLISEVDVALGKAGSSNMGPDYPNLPQLEAGYPNAKLTTATIPCVILKAIGYVESSWHQARGTVPRGTAGQTLVSGSCGYGIMQITSGMRAPGDLPPADQKRIAEDYKYNVAWGAKMLADKWNHAPEWRPVVGNRDPKTAENWYYAVWSYNSWGWRNNPNNPDFPSVRPAFTGTQSRTNYPYQELVWGYAANPPKNSGSPLWSAVSLTLPDRAGIGTDPGWIPTPSPPHESPCLVLRVKPTSLQLIVEPGGKSKTQSFEIEIAGSDSSAWTATANKSWIRLAPPSGSSVPATVHISVDATGLAKGRYNGTVVIESSGATGSPQTVNIEARVGPIFRLYLPDFHSGN